MRFIGSWSKSEKRNFIDVILLSLVLLLVIMFKSSESIKSIFINTSSAAIWIIILFSSNYLRNKYIENKLKDCINPNSFILTFIGQDKRCVGVWIENRTSIPVTVRSVQLLFENKKRHINLCHVNNELDINNDSDYQKIPIGVILRQNDHNEMGKFIGNICNFTHNKICEFTELRPYTKSIWLATVERVITESKLETIQVVFEYKTVAGHAKIVTTTLAEQSIKRFRKLYCKFVLDDIAIDTCL